MDDFQSFFKKATGYAPYPYQSRLATDPKWPEALEVPTGSGKTAAVILGWLWRRRFAPEEVRKNTGRRLVLCMPMRSLTTQTVGNARLWLSRLGLTEAPEVHTLMGGSVDDDWIRAPMSDAILVGTQDMLLSRALNRGFGMSSYSWPMPFGLLHNDVQWVFDEVQLMGVGASTSAQLDAFRSTFHTYGPSHSLWMSATLQPSRLATIDHGPLTDVMQLSSPERETGELARLLSAGKRVQKLPVEATDSSAVARAVAKAHRAGSRTLVVVNTVRRAQELFRALRKISRTDTNIELLHSRFRPGDRSAIEANVLHRDWSGILVSTQVVEAGLDISARVLITELAPWASFVQRAGRCNRWAEFTDAEIRWIDLADDDALARPYTPEDLDDARQRLLDLADASPGALSAQPLAAAPVETPVLRRKDLLDLFDTTPDLTGAQVDVSAFVRNGEETDVLVCWRDLVRGAPPAKETLLPIRDEQCRVSIGDARAFLKKLASDGHIAWRWSARDDRWVEVESPVPSQVWLLASSAGGYTAAEGFTGGASDPVTPIAGAVTLPESEGDDFWANRQEESLDSHTDRVVLALETFLRDVSGLPAPAIQSLQLAARWHDAGKAHPVFQQTMHGSSTDRDVMLAKSTSSRKHERSGFRHEVASGLALMQAFPADFTAAYLVAAHHGRARIVIRARPNESGPRDGRRFTLGIWDGDVLPDANLGGGVAMRSCTLDPRVFDFGGSNGELGWTARALELRDDLGVFRLGWLEAVLRAADWVGSAAAGGSNG